MGILKTMNLKFYFIYAILIIVIEDGTTLYEDKATFKRLGETLTIL